MWQAGEFRESGECVAGGAVVPEFSDFLQGDDIGAGITDEAGDGFDALLYAEADIVGHDEHGWVLQGRGGYRVMCL